MSRIILITLLWVSLVPLFSNAADLTVTKSSDWQIVPGDKIAHLSGQNSQLIDASSHISGVIATLTRNPIPRDVHLTTIRGIDEHVAGHLKAMNKPGATILSQERIEVGPLQGLRFTHILPVSGVKTAFVMISLFAERDVYVISFFGPAISIPEATLGSYISRIRFSASLKRMAPGFRKFESGNAFDLIGSTWHITYDTPRSTHLEFQLIFCENGELIDTHPNTPGAGTGKWTAHGKDFQLRFNEGYVLFNGNLSDRDHMSGTAINAKGESWKFQARRLDK